MGADGEAGGCDGAQPPPPRLTGHGESAGCHCLPHECLLAAVSAAFHCRCRIKKRRRGSLPAALGYRLCRNLEVHNVADQEALSLDVVVRWRSHAGAFDRTSDEVHAVLRLIIPEIFGIDQVTGRHRVSETRVDAAAHGAGSGRSAARYPDPNTLSPAIPTVHGPLTYFTPKAARNWCAASGGMRSPLAVLLSAKNVAADREAGIGQRDATTADTPGRCSCR